MTDSNGGRTMLDDKREIGAAVVVTEEHRQPPIAALGDVVGDAGDANAGKSGHNDGGTRPRRWG